MGQHVRKGLDFENILLSPKKSLKLKVFQKCPVISIHTSHGKGSEHFLVFHEGLKLYLEKIDEATKLFEKGNSGSKEIWKSFF